MYFSERWDSLTHNGWNGGNGWNGWNGVGVIHVLQNKNVIFCMPRLSRVTQSRISGSSRDQVGLVLELASPVEVKGVSRKPSFISIVRYVKQM